MSDTPIQSAQTQEPEVDEFALKLEQLRKKQKPLLAISAGILAFIATTVLWILMASKYQVSWMALAVGFGTAFSIQYAGKIVDQWYGCIAAFLTLLAIIVGTLNTAVNIFATGKKIAKSEVLAQLDFSMAMSFFTAIMRPIDVLLSLGAIFAAFWFSFKHIEPPQP
jgi:hypothetical protein